MKRWPKVRLGDIAPVVRRPIDIDLEGAYPELGIRSFGKGTFHKPMLAGSSVGSKRLFRIERGDLIFSNVFAWEGAVAVAGSQDEGRFGSHRFITCVVDNKRAIASFLWRYLVGSSEGLEQLRRASPGGAGRNRTLGVQKLAEIEVPLPPRDVQQSTVARLDALADKVRQLTSHLDSIENDANALVRSYILGSATQSATRRRMSDLVRLRSPDISVDRQGRYQFAGVFSFGRGVFASANKSGNEFAYDRLSTVRAGDFIYPKLMAWEGALGIVPPECDGMVVSPEFPVFSVDVDVILPEILDIYFRTPTVWPELAGLSGGTNVRRRRLQPSAFLKYEIPVPPMVVQHKIREIHQRTLALRARHRAIRAAASALLPATLERIFDDGIRT